MADGSQVGRRFAIGLVATLAWFSLFIAVASTAAIVSVGTLSHVGTTASKLVKSISEKPATINSMIDEFKKNADPKTAAEIERNRRKIASTISSLGSSKEFQNLLSATLNQISQAILDGSKSVKVDFTKIATLVAGKINDASESTVISQKDLAKIKPQVWDLSKQSGTVISAHNRLREVLLTWILWLIFLGVLYLFIGWRMLRTAGWHLFSIGIFFLLIRFGGPIVVGKIMSDSALPIYQRDLVPQVLSSLTGPIVLLSIVISVSGFLMIILEQLLHGRMSSNKPQMRPSVVA